MNTDNKNLLEAKFKLLAAMYDNSVVCMNLEKFHQRFHDVFGTQNYTYVMWDEQIDDGSDIAENILDAITKITSEGKQIVAVHHDYIGKDNITVAVIMTK